MPPSVTRATRHLPAAMAEAAWPTWHTYDEPPVSVLSMYEQCSPMYSAMDSGPKPGASPAQK